MTAGVIIGKFWPPHSGHQALIEFAQTKVDTIYVLVCATDMQRPQGRDRARWVQQIFPKAEVILTEDFCIWHAPGPCLTECSMKWANRVRELVFEPIDAVFASEEYGTNFGAAMGATFFPFDPPRLQHSISGTAIRENPFSNWSFLHPYVKSGLTRKVSVMGAESTGTTTLSNQLATYLGIPCVPEIGRTISWELMATAGSMEKVEWTPHIFWDILTKHATAEDSARAQSIMKTPQELGPWIVADTDALATIAWWERYLGEPTVDVRAFADSRLADAYIVTSPDDVDFHQDGIRDGENVRLQMHERFLELAHTTDRPVLLAQGTPSQRLDSAIQFLEGVVRQHPIFS